MGGAGQLQALLSELSGLKKPRGFMNRVVRRMLGMRPKPPPKYRIMVMMATNLPQALDEALLRPGRIDRIYKVGYPSKAGRIRTYEGYFDKVRHCLTPAEIDKLATITPYATGATIKDLVNESLIYSIRMGRDTITWEDVIKAKQLKDLGPPEDVEYIERERHAVAVHEACHAVTAFRVRRHLTIDIATIEKGGNYLGMVASIPPEDQFTQWRTEYEADVMVSLASLAGERMFFAGDNSSGVSGDLEGATQLATLMEGYWGMGSTVTSHGVTQKVGIGGGGRPGKGDGKGPKNEADLLHGGLGERIEEKLEELLQRAEDLLQGQPHRGPGRGPRPGDPQDGHRRRHRGHHRGPPRSADRRTGLRRSRVRPGGGGVPRPGHHRPPGPRQLRDLAAQAQRPAPQRRYDVVTVRPDGTYAGPSPWSRPPGGRRPPPPPPVPPVPPVWPGPGRRATVRCPTPPPSGPRAARLTNGPVVENGPVSDGRPPRTARSRTAPGRETGRSTDQPGRGSCGRGSARSRAPDRGIGRSRPAPGIVRSGIVRSGIERSRMAGHGRAADDRDQRGGRRPTPEAPPGPRRTVTLRTTELRLDTSGRPFTDLTNHVAGFCRSLGDGLVHVFVPHATAGVALMELGSGSEADLAELLERLLPRDDRYRHRHGAPGHGADHLLPVLVNPSLSIPVEAGRPLLGTWQSVVLVDLNRDNPHRQVRLSFLPG